MRFVCAYVNTAINATSTWLLQNLMFVINTKNVTAANDNDDYCADGCQRVLRRFLPSRYAKHRLCSRCCNKFVSRLKPHSHCARIRAYTRAVWVLLNALASWLSVTALQQFIRNKGLVLLHSFNSEPERWMMISNQLLKPAIPAFTYVIRTSVTGRWVCDDRFYGLVNRSNR